MLHCPHLVDAGLVGQPHLHEAVVIDALLHAVVPGTGHGDLVEDSELHAVPLPAQLLHFRAGRRLPGTLGGRGASGARLRGHAVAVSEILDGVRVLDFGRYIAGPYCACLLGDLGADVIRVERVGGSEDRWVTPVGEDGAGALFLQVNRNKRGMTLDPMSAGGRGVARPDRVATLNRAQTAGPSDIFATADGWIIVQVVGRPLFERWAKLMGDDNWLTDPRFADDDGRGRNGELLSERMGRWCARRTTGEALAELEAARIPAGPVYSPQQALEDPHVLAAGLLQPT